MKKTLKITLLLSFALTLQNQIWGNLSFDQPLITLVKVAFVLMVFELLLKPIIKILLIPINILTLGFFRIVINTLGFYLASFIFIDFKVNPISIQSFIWQGFTIPSIYFSGFWAYVVSSTTTNFILSLFKNILKPKKETKWKSDSLSFK